MARSTIASRIKTGIGSLLGQHQQSPSSAQGSAQPQQPTIIHDPLGMSTEEILETVSFDIPRHRQIANTVKNIWRIIGPACFVLFTAWEVFYFMSHFMAAAGDDSWQSKALLWGITLLIEIPFMVATYDQSDRKEALAEKRALGRAQQEKDQLPSIVMWFVLASVNVAGQVAFLLFVTKMQSDPFHNPTPATLGMWFFIVVRVLGVLVGDSYTAFFLKPDETTIERVLRVQGGQAKGRIAIQENRAELAEMKADSDANIRRIAMRIRKEERDAEFLNELNELNMQSTLNRQRQFFIEEEKPLQIEEKKESNVRQLKGL